VVQFETVDRDGKWSMQVELKHTIRFAVEKETPNAVKYQEIDAQGRTLQNGVAKVGSLYVRKATFGKGVIPNIVEIDLKY